MEAEAAIRHLVARDRVARPHIVVIGDCLIDEVYRVRVERVSPEFPIPIIHSENAEPVGRFPGGAGNVCRQFCRLNASHAFFSLLNYPAFDVSSRCGVDVDNSLIWNFQIPVKKRYYHGDSMVSRWDAEAPTFGLEDHIAEGYRKDLLADFRKYLKKNDVHAVIAADYEKGVFSDRLARGVVKACLDRGVPLIVDPKRNYRRWRGCTIFKPNLREARAMAQKSTPVTQLAGALKDLVLCRDIVVTDEGRGVHGWADGQLFLYGPKRPVTDVRDPVGAGDCFAAYLAAGVAHGLKTDEAAAAAFEAGAVYVQKRHACPVAPHELLARVDPVAAKIVTAEELARIRQHLDGTVVFTNGCFDIFHHGHINTLNFAKGNGDHLIVGVNDDASVARLKGGDRPVQKLPNRAGLLAALGCVDFVVPFGQDTPEELVIAAAPHFIVKGEQYRGQQVVGADQAPVLYAPQVDGLSTTTIIERIKK